MEYFQDNDEIWRLMCLLQFSDISNSAYKKSLPGVTWYHLYRSLTLWPDLANTEETKIVIAEIDLNTSIEERTINFQVLRDGIIGVLQQTGIVYYDINTFQQLQGHISVDNTYTRYSENDYFFILFKNNSQLLVKRKEKWNGREIVKVINHVKKFLIIENVIYCVTWCNYIHKYYFENGVFTSIFLEYINSNVLALGHENGLLYFLTKRQFEKHNTIESLVGNELRTVLSNGTIKEELDAFTRYFVNHMYLTELWLLLDGVSMHYPPRLRDIQIIHTHGPILLVGYEPGILYIFHSLYTTSMTDLIFLEPLKICSLLEPENGITHCSIINIDVVEGKDNHTVLVATYHKVFAIKFSYRIGNYEEWFRRNNKPFLKQLMNY